jgi:phage shock protein PspC (stress-responsive transcriptional regulator)
MSSGDWNGQNLRWTQGRKFVVIHVLLAYLTSTSLIWLVYVIAIFLMQQVP